MVGRISERYLDKREAWKRLNIKVMHHFYDSLEVIAFTTRSVLENMMDTEKQNVVTINYTNY
jgi:hypothetical protein